MIDARTKLMLDKLVAQVNGGYIDNDWAIEFITNIQFRVKQGYPLTERQLTKLEELFEMY